jgi:hypothetical protein
MFSISFLFSIIVSSIFFTYAISATIFFKESIDIFAESNLKSVMNRLAEVVSLLSASIFELPLLKLTKLIYAGIHSIMIK